MFFSSLFCFVGSKSTGLDEEDGAGVIEFENALNFWREYKVESELPWIHSNELSSHLFNLKKFVSRVAKVIFFPFFFTLIASYF